VSVTLSVDSKGLRAKLAGLARAIAPGVKKCIRLAVQGAEYEVVRQNFTGYAGGRGRLQKLQNRSGMLRRSVGHKVMGSTLADLVGKIGAHAPYAKAHEYGRPAMASTRGKKYYTIPTRNSLTGAGVLRKPITAWMNDPSAFFLRIGGRLMFARSIGKGKRARLEVLFNLYRFPTPPIPPRLGIRKAVDRQRVALREGIIKTIMEAFR